MSQTQSLSFKWVAGIATGILAIVTLHTTLVASPKDVDGLRMKAVALEARFDALDSRARVDHDILVEIRTTLQELKARK